MPRRTSLSSQRAKELHAELRERANVGLAEIIERNIDIIDLLRRHRAATRSTQEKLADAMTAWSGSIPFVYAHAVWFGAWIAANLGWIPGVKPFDPFPFGLLTMIVSLEAIFLSTFVLVSQNREAIQNEQHEGLDLQIDILAEYEITRMLRLVDKMAEKMGIQDAFDAEIDQLCVPVAPDVVLKEIERRRQSAV